MIYESIEDYIEDHIDEEPEYLKELYRDANLRLLYPRMVSGHIQGRLLKMLTKMIRPKNVLELGTFAGYSTICIADGLPEEGRIDTIEIDDELESFILQHFERYPGKDKIHLHIGDALDIIPEIYNMSNGWDMVFIDADKRLYPDYYRLILPCMKRGGWILADNTLWNGKVLEDTQSSKHKNDLQLKGILDFNRMVGSDPRVEKVILPVRDGLTIIRVI